MSGPSRGDGRSATTDIGGSRGFSASARAPAGDRTGASRPGPPATRGGRASRAAGSEAGRPEARPPASGRSGTWRLRSSGGARDASPAGPRTSSCGPGSWLGPRSRAALPGAGHAPQARRGVVDRPSWSDEAARMKRHGPRSPNPRPGRLGRAAPLGGPARDAGRPPSRTRPEPSLGDPETRAAERHRRSGPDHPGGARPSALGGTKNDTMRCSSALQTTQEWPPSVMRSSGSTPRSRKAR